MEVGWIKLYRSLKDWEWYKDSNTKSLFLHLLLMANHKPNKWMGITVGRGQIAVGRKTLSNDLGLSEQNVRTILTRLEKTENITIIPTSKYSLITVMKYDDFQDGNQHSNQQTPNDQPATNQQSTSDQPATNHKQEYNNAENAQNDENEKNTKAPKAQRRKISYSEDEQFFWKYAHDLARPEDTKCKSDILKKYRARRKDGFTQDQMLKFVDLHTEESKANWDRRFGIRGMLEKDNLEQVLNGNVKKDSPQQQGPPRDAWDDLIDHLEENETNDLQGFLK